jgi:peptide/nickel transport system substrate-binding protein
MFKPSHLIKVMVLLILGLVLVACTPAAAPAGETEGGATTEGGETAEVAEDVTTEGDMSTGLSADASPYINLCEGEPVDGGSITLAIADDAMVGRNWLSRGSTNESFLFSQLTDLSIEDAETIEPDVATSWEVSDDGLTYTYNLRDDVLWHDGEQLTAADVKFSIELFAHPDSGATVRSVLPLDAIVGFDEFSAGEADEITGVTTPSDYQVVIELKQPRADFLYGMGGMNLQAKHVFDGIAFADMQTSPYAREQVVGSGPFKMGEFEPDQYYILDAFDDYYKGRPHLDQLIFRIGLTSVASWMPGLEAGEIQVGSMVNGLDRERVEGNESLTVVGAPLPGAMAIWPNHTKFPDKRILQAMMYAIDREAITAGIYGPGQALPYDYDNVDPNHNWISPEINDYSYDPDMARQLLAEAGWDSSQTVQFATYYQTELDRNVVAAMQQFWAEVGLTVEVAHMDAPAWAAQVYEDPTYELAYGCCGISVPFEYGRYSCPNVPPAGLNVSSYCNEEVDAKVQQAMVEPDEATRQQLWYEISQITNDEVLHMTLFQQDRRHAINKNVCNYQFRQWSNIVWPERNPHTWYLAQ